MHKSTLPATRQSGNYTNGQKPTFSSVNYLAHLFFSVEDAELTFGNFIADSVKGKQYEVYPGRVQKGILMHRFIDGFTDRHPVSAVSRQRLRPSQGKWAGVVTDVVYDHFLAVDFARHGNTFLQDFASGLYLQLSSTQSRMPLRSQRFLHYMVTNNILVNYKQLHVVRDVLFGMDQRTKFVSNMASAIPVVEGEYDQFHEDFSVFFEDLKAAVAEWKANELENHRIG